MIFSHSAHVPILSKTQPAQRTITFITQEFRPKIGGAATVVAELAEATATMGIDTCVIAPGQSQPDDESTPYSIERTGTRGKQDWADRIALLRYLRKRKPGSEEEYVFAEPGAVRAGLYAHFFQVPVPRPPTLILHGTEILRFTALPHRRALLRRLANQCRTIHVLSDFNRQLLQARVPGLTAPITLSPGAPSRRVEIPPSQTSLRSNPDGPITILTVGRIHPRKGQLETLQALSRLPTALQKRIRYRIVGPSVRSHYRESLLQHATTCPFPVEIPGPLSDEELEKEYASADIFALTSRQDRMSVEGFGLVYLDASALGLPVVATRSGGIPEAVLDGRTGLLADEGSIDQIAQCFQKLICDPQLRQQLGQQGREHAQRHNWHATADSLFGSATSTPKIHQ
ncbi:MAG: glycosyltransferase family 4 protein [Puniceicoccales bacterium]